MYLLRRVFYAIVLITLGNEQVLGVMFILLGCLLMLVYGVSEMQWAEPLINK